MRRTPLPRGKPLVELLKSPGIVHATDGVSLIVVEHAHILHVVVGRGKWIPLIPSNVHLPQFMTRNISCRRPIFWVPRREIYFGRRGMEWCNRGAAGAVFSTEPPSRPGKRFPLRGAPKLLFSGYLSWFFEVGFVSLLSAQIGFPGMNHGGCHASNASGSHERDDQRTEVSKS